MQISVRLNAGEALGDRILKVDHAGEHGAVCIYSGQIALARITAPHLAAELREFISHEKRHRSVFQRELEARDVRRCRSYGLIGAAGFLLGLLTGLCGAGAVRATTVAIERVVLRHLAEQMEALRGLDAAAFAAISNIVAEEQQHHDQSLQRLSGKIWLKILTPVVAVATEAVIWLGMHL